MIPHHHGGGGRAWRGGDVVFRTDASVATRQ
jgi:hypothetical protein